MNELTFRPALAVKSDASDAQNQPMYGRFESEDRMNVNGVIVSIEAKLPNSNLIKLEEVIIHGSGTLSEALDGGQSSYSLVLNHGKELKPLTKNESVWVQGQFNGSAFRLPVALLALSTREPWEFLGVSGQVGFDRPASGLTGRPA